MQRYESFADYVRDLLKRHGIQQGQLAAYIGASSQAMTEWLKRARRPEPKFLWRIAQYDRQDFVELMQVAGWIPPEEDTPQADPIPPWLERDLPLLTQLDELEGGVISNSARGLLTMREQRSKYESQPPGPRSR